MALAFTPTENFNLYSYDAFHLARLGVAEGLTKLDGNGTAAPALAESWTSEKGGRSWLFTLRQAKFQDGEAVGDDQVRVGTGRPDPVLPARLSNPSLAVLSPKAYEKKGTANPVGTATGPFELTKFAGDTAATLDRFDDYWGGRAQAPGIDVRFITDGTARANSLRTGQTDIAEAVPVAQIASLDKGTVHETNTARNTSLYLNTKSGVFADAGLRAAAREAIDTSVIAEDVYEGHAEAAQGIYGPALNWAASKRLEPIGRAEATAPGGKSITIATYTGRAELAEAAQVLQQQLQKAGFKVKLEVRDYERLEGDLLAGKFDAAVVSRNVMLDTGDPVSVLASDFTCDGTFNLSLLCDKDVDKAVADAQAMTDTAKRQEAAMKAEAEILGTDAVVPLVHLKVATGIRASVQGALLDPYERQFIGTGTRR